ncbi:flavin reductase family protein [Sediminivirga luteola]|jgi:flavin reductase (DIM6/NTAB) family NADH-FMN oxidoreductase RutF|uniref:Putative flavin-dependent reductase n=1 Tax=Sediminivirga luteola TaxID=1774748 RepID=A0A8J2U0R5_9MICO|nr:flavin reductase family protein [Sediminivirga luteola]MCI2266858.1 flavin reductase family protein [Sediminivirga luteola]GGA26709.1 putative flavin-dependent reductase [Sediminivirga luteola]
MTSPHSSAEAFKAAFRVHPAGVAIIAAAGPDGPVGLTASSVASVSAEPPALSFSVAQSGGSAGGVLQAETFSVNLLSAAQAGIAEAFARSGMPRFTPEQNWRAFPTGEPYLPDAPAALRCRPLERLAVGQSTLILAEVLDVLLQPQDSALAYHNRRFLGVVPEGVVPA